MHYRAIFLLLSLLLVSCGSREPLYNTQSYVFGTLVDISIYGETDTRAQTLASEVIHQYQSLHQRLHAWQPSEIKTLNDAFAQGKTPVKVSPDIAKMVNEITQLSAQSQDVFNPAIGNLIKLWGFQSDEFKPQNIDDDKIKELVTANPQMTDIVIEGNNIISNNPSVQLDLGGYAKGYALDLGLTYLRQQGVKNALINIGGNIIALGQHGDKPWRVGIQHPRQPNAIATVALPSGWAIGTSGDYQRFFMLDGKRYCHIINPATGYPVQNMQSVTVLIPPQHNAGTLSDVVSKPIFIAKSDARVKAAQTMDVDNFLIIGSEQNIQISTSMAKHIIWLDAELAKQVKTVNLDK